MFRPSAARAVGDIAHIRICMVDAIIGRNGGGGYAALLVGGKGRSLAVCLGGMKQGRFSGTLIAERGVINMGKGNFSTSTQERYLEDYVVGSVHEFGPVTITEEEIVQFGKNFDPQPYHTDPQRALETIHRGLIASGWHTCALFMRLFVEHYLAGPASLGSPGVDELRWLKPVRPGDQLRLRITVDRVIPSRSKPDRGVLYSFCEMLNQKRQIVATMMALSMIRYRDRG